MRSAAANPVLAALLSLVLASVQAPASAQANVGTPALEVAVASGGTSLRASGTWATRFKRGSSSSIAPLNAVEIHCSRASMTCWESRAELLGGEGRVKTAAPENSREQLAVSTLVFTVTEWTDSRITARSDTRMGDLMLRIVPSEKLVRLSYWDTRGNPPKGSASGFVWELQ